MDDDRLTKITENGKPNTPGHLDGLQKLVRKLNINIIEEQDKIRHMVLSEKKEEENIFSGKEIQSSESVAIDLGVQITAIAANY